MAKVGEEKGCRNDYVREKDALTSELDGFLNIQLEKSMYLHLEHSLESGK